MQNKQFIEKEMSNDLQMRTTQRICSKYEWMQVALPIINLVIEKLGDLLLVKIVMNNNYEATLRSDTSEMCVKKSL